MSAGIPQSLSKSYVECAVQTDERIIPSPSPTTLSLSHVLSSASVSDAGHELPLTLSPSSSRGDAYTDSSPCPAPLSEQRPAKPRLTRNKPGDTNAVELARTVSMPETAPGFLVKTELKQTHRIVSMPDPPPKHTRLSIGDSSISSDSGNMSISSAANSSFASVDDTTAGICLPSFGTELVRLHTPSPSCSSDSILIIEHNGELADGFLHPATIKEETEETDKKHKSEDDKDWISWTHSPPRPIPALHGPLSLPYARCPSGAEGTIIEEPESLPRMIWGLDSDAQSSPLEEIHETPAAVVIHPSSESTTAAAKVPPPQQSLVSIRPPAQGSENQPPAAALPPLEAQRARQMRQDTVPVGDYVRSSPLGIRRTSGQAAAEDFVYSHDPEDDGIKVSEARFYDFGKVREVPRSNKSHEFSQPTTVGNMKVTARPAPGSALPQIFIEPLSPGAYVPSRHEYAALESNQQYHGRKLMDYLPTPPSSSSPLWSPNFSPYQESLPSPSLTSYMNVSEQLRRLIHERLSDMSSPSLAPAAQIDTYPTSLPVADFNELSSPQELLKYIARREMLIASQASQATGVSQRARKLSNHSQPSYTAGTSRDRHHSSQSSLRQGYSPPSPTSPEMHLHVPRGYTTHQPRSIPLTRLIQRRLSAVPEEDAASTLRGRSPSPVPRGFDRRVRRQPSGPPSEALAYDYGVTETCAIAREGERVKVRLPLTGNARTSQEETFDQQPRPRIGSRARLPPRGPLGPNTCDDCEPEQTQKEVFRKKTPRGGNGTAVGAANGRPARKATYGASIAGRI
ncbi:hypothetical protein K488DRAFT_86190 [Vararia minispora EC-137]|uniref:Uncharacterized protein n=1 Tax=Vararia minispora EC-137 TaxID=1314806 RepID=A0ACB8QJU4_9AGAM|nr:hypothetical protein K488DRAFT_86190 [Vararia minispora EC-137]